MRICIDTYQAHWVALFGRAAVFALLMWAPLQVAADSEEEVTSEWTLWKKLHKISYDEEVSYDNLGVA